MFVKLFTRAATIAAYLSAPLLEERLRYLSHCGQYGATRYTLRAIADLHRMAKHEPNLRAAEVIETDEFEALPGVAVQHWPPTDSPADGDHDSGIRGRPGQSFRLQTDEKTTDAQHQNTMDGNKETDGLNSGNQSIQGNAAGLGWRYRSI